MKEKLHNDNIFKKLRENENTKNNDWSRKNSLTVTKLASQMNVSKSVISQIENGKDPSLSMIKKYHDRFNVSYEELIDEKSNLNSEFINNVHSILGLDKQSIQTLKDIKLHSRQGINYIEMINFIIGNNVSTLLFIMNILSCYSDEVNYNEKLNDYACSNNTDVDIAYELEYDRKNLERELDRVLYRYFDNYVKPRAQGLATMYRDDRNQHLSEETASIDNTTSSDSLTPT